MAFPEDNLRKKKKVLRKKLLLWTTVLLIIFLLGINSIIPIIHQKRQIASLEKEIEETNQKNKILMDEIKALKTDPTRIEDLARQAGMRRHGEKEVKFIPKERE
ncbi:MAG: septum formation initiator family protein [Nitrospirota bacterium]